MSGWAFDRGMPRRPMFALSRLGSTLIDEQRTAPGGGAVRTVPGGGAVQRCPGGGAAMIDSTGTFVVEDGPDVVRPPGGGARSAR